MPSTSRQAFFSFAHADAEHSPELVSQLARSIEAAVNAKLVSFTFSVWLDRRLLIGDVWDDKIRHELSNSDYLIVLYSPSWIQSEYCRKELDLFKSLSNRKIFPVVFQHLDKDEFHYLDSDQQRVAHLMKSVQYQEFGHLFYYTSSEGERRQIIDAIAEAIKREILSSPSDVSVTQP